MEPGERYWNAIDPIWDEIEIDDPEGFQLTFGKIPPELGNLYAAHFCQSEVCNGGFTQFFWNSTGVLAPEAVRGFTAIGQPKVASIVERAMMLLDQPYMRDRKARWATLERLGAGGDRLPRSLALFEALEEEFYSLLSTEAGGFESAADRYTEEHGLGSVAPEPRSFGDQLQQAVGKLSKDELQDLERQLDDIRARLGENTADE